MIRSIIYQSYSIIPSEYANSVHVFNMVNALSECADRVSVIYKSPRLGGRPAWKHKVRALPMPLGGSREIWRGLLYALHSASSFHNRGQGTLAYGRYLPGLMAAPPDVNFGYEAHVFPKSQVRRLMESALFSKANFKSLVVISTELKREYLQWDHRLAPKILVAHDGANPINASTAPNAVARHNLQTVGYVGSLNPGKGGDLILEMAALAKDLKFLIAGGPDNQVLRLKSLAHQKGLTNITFLGHTPHSELSSIYNSISIGLAPYAKIVNGAAGTTNLAPWMSPLKIFEYMANGIPTIATDLPTIREIITPGLNGILAPHDDAIAWVREIRNIFGSPNLFATLSMEAQKSLVSNFTWAARAKRITEHLTRHE